MNFLQLVNDVCYATGEVPLTSSTFATTAGNTGFYADAKKAVNAAIRKINQYDFEWPFNHVTVNKTLVAGTARYAFESDAKTIMFDTFRIQRDATFNNKTRLLKEIAYERYLERYIDDEYRTETSVRDTPRLVSRAPNQYFVVNPIPDEAYTLTYEYFKLPTDLVNHDDEPSLPDQFKYVVNDGAMAYAEYFRENLEKSTLYTAEFNRGIEAMRSIYINRPVSMETTYIVKPSKTGNFIETAN